MLRQSLFLMKLCVGVLCGTHVLRLPPTGSVMRVAGLRGDVILVLFVGLVGRLSVVKVVDLLAG